MTSASVSLLRNCISSRHRSACSAISLRKNPIWNSCRASWLYSMVWYGVSSCAITSRSNSGTR